MNPIKRVQPIMIILCGLATLPFGAAAQESDLVGDWLGTLTVGPQSLRIVFHVTSSEDGSLTATMDSPDQGAMGIPLSGAALDGWNVIFELAAAAAEFNGTLAEDLRTIDGTWSQGGMDFPLELTRTEEEIAPPVRPQDPTRPLPYVEEVVRYPNPEAGFELAGTLTLPSQGGPFPAAILISGSGPQNRDEELLGHRPFLVLSDHLTRNGIAVLRFDDRGVGESGGSFAAATSADFATDVAAGVDFLRSRAEIDPERIGLIGHSEGGLIAPMVAGGGSPVAYVVLMAGPGLSGEEILYLQAALIAEANGATAEAIETNRTSQAALFRILREEPDNEAARARMQPELEAAFHATPEEDREALGQADSNVEALIEQQIQQLTSPWFRYFLTYDPVPALEALDVPVLAVNGEKDLQVPPVENLAAIEAALGRGGNPDATLAELEGLNHLFQAAQTGAPSEYQGIEETMSPVVLDMISNWILERVGH